MLIEAREIDLIIRETVEYLIAWGLVKFCSGQAIFGVVVAEFHFYGYLPLVVRTSRVHSIDAKENDRVIMEKEG